MLHQSVMYVGLPHVSLAHRQANHACEGDWKVETRFTRVKDRLGKKQAEGRRGVVRTRMDGGILVVGERGIA